jgi:hypothetical protein
MRCSTVTPGKFATFCRRPVSRLNSVDLPELGGPTTATTCRRVGMLGGGKIAAGHPWQSPILFQDEPHSGFAAQRDFRSIDAKHARIAARRRMTAHDGMARQEP